MLDALKSLMGGSLGSYAPQELQPQADSNNKKNKEQPGELNTNPAVEINISAQGQRIMAAIESGELKLDEQGLVRRNDEISSQPVPRANNENTVPISNPFKALENVIEGIVSGIETGQFAADDVDEIDKLFGEIVATLNNQSAEVQPTEETMANNAEDLTAQDQIKAVILYSELNRLLGNVGVFFGRDLTLAKMTVSAQQNASVIFDELSSTLGHDQVDNLNTAQEARVDAIFRELEQLYAAARKGAPAAETIKINDFFQKLENSARQ